jgi:hypothetical protein
MTKLRKQLGAADADERHAFLFIGWEHTEGWPLELSTTDEEMSLPTTPPVLPESVDALWLASMAVRSRVIAWLPRVGWIEGKTETEEPSGLSDV